MTLCFGLRRQTALSNACKAGSNVMWACIDQPTTRLENRSITTARYDHPSCVLMCVISVTQTRLGAATSNCRSNALSATIAGLLACRQSDQDDACIRSVLRCPQGWPTAPHGSQNRYNLDPKGHRAVCGSHRPCRCQSKPAGSDRFGVWLPAHVGSTVL